MQIRKAYSYIITFFLLLSVFALPAQAIEPALATLQVMILDENGSLVHTAHVYIFSRNKKSFFGTRDAHGTANFNLPEGNYRVYAAYTINTNGIIDHYASPEACVHLTSEEPNSIILSLQKSDNNEMTLSDTARKKLGIDEELAKYLN